jgi:glycosyltransferase A (GT-A) superfamily protein (DUF2064 family)
MSHIVPAALVVFCRRPALGNGKQRLARVLGRNDALAIANALLDCALEDAAGWPHDLVISPACRDDAAWAASLVARPAWVEAQPEDTLGRRLNGVDRSLRARGLERLIYIGTDAPSLTVGDLLAALDGLEHADVVLGPAADGGVTLMGSRRAWPDLGNLPWSEPTLGAALEQHCRQSGLSVSRARASYDVDEVLDLVTASRALAGDSRPARRRLRALLDATVRGQGLVAADTLAQPASETIR